MSRFAQVIGPAAVVLTLAWGASVSLGSGSSSVSDVVLAPNKVYDDLPRITVAFTTSVQARTGTRYFAVLDSLGPPSAMTPGCSPSSQFNEVGVRGGVAKRVAIVLKPEPLLGDAFCPGPSQIRVIEQLSSPRGVISGKATTKTSVLLAKSPFRIYREP